MSRAPAARASGGPRATTSRLQQAGVRMLDVWSHVLRCMRNNTNTMQDSVAAGTERRSVAGRVQLLPRVTNDARVASVAYRKEHVTAFRVQLCVRQSVTILFL